MNDSAPATPPNRRAAVGVFALLLAIYLLTTGGHFYASDEEIMFSLTESMVLSHSFVLNSGSGEAPRYSQYGPGQSVAAIPFYWAGQALASAFPPEAYAWLTRLAASWLNPLATAACGALVFLAAQQLGFRRGPALGAALAYGLGTMAWPHSKTFFAEPLNTLVLFAAFVLLGVASRARAAGRPTAGWLLLSGVLAGLGPTVKIQSGVVLPLLGLYTLALFWRWEGRHWRVLQHAALWGVGALLPLVLLGAYQYALFRNPVRSGYGDVWTTFTTPFWYGFNGQLWSPGRGIIFYAPLTLLFPLGLWQMRRRLPAEALLCAAVFAAHILFYATWWAWDGAGAWGPRFLNVALPFVCLPLAAVFATLWSRRWLRAVVVLLAVATVPVQLAGLLINLNGFIGVTRSERISPFRVGDSAIVGHWQLGLGYLERWYNLQFAPDSLALRDGFSYSEGGENQPLPRWTLPEATFALRPAAGRAAEINLQLTSCGVQPSPEPVRFTFENGVSFTQALCPGRRVRLLLPASATTLRLASVPFASPEILDERGEALGVQLLAASAAVDGQPLALQADALPTWPMPTGSQTLRRWMSDYRLAHWDVIWYYLGHTRFPATPIWLLGAAWLAVIAALAGLAFWLLRFRVV